jgi:hypothetical protein
MESKNQEQEGQNKGLLHEILGTRPLPHAIPFCKRHIGRSRDRSRGGGTGSRQGSR